MIKMIVHHIFTKLKTPPKNQKTNRKTQQHTQVGGSRA
jgi:hypothetical protein